MDQRFAGLNALVVGGGADGPPLPADDLPIGNGRAIAQRLASEGARVAVTDRVLRLAQETVDSCTTPGVAIEADAADPDACRRSVHRAEAVLGGLDVVVGNVGVGGGLPINRQTVDDWDLTMAVNARAHWIVAAAALPQMLERGNGAFVFVSSLSGTTSNGLALAYEASKAAQLAVSRHIAVRYAARGIRSNAVLLGYIDSTMARRVQGTDPDRVGWRERLAPIGRQGTPLEVAAAVAYLASTDATYVNGAVVTVDGGVSAQAPDTIARPTRKAP